MKLQTPLVSVIMNCYNSSKYLSEALNSVLDQTYSNWEIIFWDNQSSDDSALIFKSYVDPRMKYFYASQHTSLGLARNMALKHATGEWCAILDCDDTWEPQKLELQINQTNRFLNVGAVYSGYSIMDNCSVKKKAGSKIASIYEGEVFNEIFSEVFTVCWPTVLLKRNVLEGIGYFNNYRYLEDYDILLRIAQENNFVYVNEKLANYRVHAEQCSVNYQIMLEEKLEIIEKWKAKWIADHSYNESKKNLITIARAKAFAIAGNNAVNYGESGLRFYINSVKHRINIYGVAGIFLSLLGPKLASASIAKVRKVLGYGEYY